MAIIRLRERMQHGDGHRVVEVAAQQANFDASTVLPEQDEALLSAIVKALLS